MNLNNHLQAYKEKKIKGKNTTTYEQNLTRVLKAPRQIGIL